MAGTATTTGGGTGAGGKLVIGCARIGVGRNSGVNDGANAVPAASDAARESKSSLTSNDHSPHTGGSRGGNSPSTAASDERSPPVGAVSNTPSGNCSESKECEPGV